jgi:hypothetical protein
MNTNSLISILIVALVLIAIAITVWFATRKVRSDKIRQKFGPEYDYAIQQEGDTKKAEQALQNRQKRVEQLIIRPLEQNVRDRYTAEWMEIQALFVDDPKVAVDQANRLITEVMIARGFPVADFEQRAADLSVLYPNFVPNYRNAFEIAQKSQNNGTSTEELRTALVYYHSLFDELLETDHSRERELEKTR